MKFLLCMVLGAFGLSAAASAQTATEFKKQMSIVESAMQRSCPYVRKRNDLSDMYPAVLIDEQPNAETAKIKVVHYPQEGIVLLSYLLAKDHPTQCGRMAIGIIYETGDVDFGVYDGCPGQTSPQEPRHSDGYGFDPKTKTRFGQKNKPAWRTNANTVIVEAVRVAQKCLK